MLTNVLAFFKMGTLTVTRPPARAKSSGSGCSAHPLSFPSRVGYDLSRQPIPTTQLENRWPSCFRQADNERSHRRLKAEPESLRDSELSGLPLVESRATKWFREKERQRLNTTTESLVTAPYTSPGQASRETVPELLYCAQSPAIAERSIRSFSGFSLRPLDRTTVLLSTKAQALSQVA